jgi:hypothetical protein
MATYKILALGDSVMWGQGLLQGHKFAQLVADHVAAPGRTVNLAALPHSGAVVCLDPTPPGGFDAFLYGELPRSFPSIQSQLEIAGQVPGYAPFLQPNDWDPAAWRSTKLSLQQAIAGYSGVGGQPPDLILVDGGINDIGALQIAIPWDLNSPDPCAGAAGAPQAGAAGLAGAVTQGGTVARVTEQLLAAGGDVTALDLAGFQWITDQKLRQLIDKYVYDRMRSLVGRLGRSFPRGKVVVTGYFPIFTEGSVDALKAHPGAVALLAHGSNENEMRAALSLAMHPALSQQDFANQVVHQSAIWYAYSTQRLQAVVDEANTRFGHRFALASPAFGPNNGALAPDALLWSFSLLIDEVLQQILKFFGASAAAPQAAAAAALGTAASAQAVFGDWGPALAFLGGLELGRRVATDEVIDVRVAAGSQYYFHSATGRSDPETNFFTGLKSGFASVGHPNVKGARAYLAAIAPFLP